MIHNSTNVACEFNELCRDLDAIVTDYKTEVTLVGSNRMYSFSEVSRKDRYRASMKKVISHAWEDISDYIAQTGRKEEMFVCMSFLHAKRINALFERTYRPISEGIVDDRLRETKHKADSSIEKLEEKITEMEEQGTIQQAYEKIEELNKASKSAINDVGALFCHYSLHTEDKKRVCMRACVEGGANQLLMQELEARKYSMMTPWTARVCHKVIGVSLLSLGCSALTVLIFAKASDTYRSFVVVDQCILQPVLYPLWDMISPIFNPEYKYQEFINQTMQKMPSRSILTGLQYAE